MIKSMLRNVVASLVLSATFVFVIVASAAGQQLCQDIDAVLLQCPKANSISGKPPNCFCDGVPVQPPLKLTCERNFGCADSAHVGAGEWPKCWCQKGRSGGGSSGGGSSGGGNGGIGGVGAGLGGVATCEQFLECPSGSKMEVQGGLCTCTLVMLPQTKE